MFEKLAIKYRYSLIILRRLVATDFKLRYQESFLGYIWSLLRPLALFVVMYVVFVYFLKAGAGIPHYAVYLLLGVVLWNYFTEVTINGLASVVSKGDLMRKLAFPRYVVVLAGSFSALINLGLNLIVVCIFMIINHVPFTWNCLMIFPLIFELFVFSLGISFLLGTLCVRFRDVSYIWEVLLQAGFYATPVLYSLAMIHQQWLAQIIMTNPVAQIIQDIRYFVVSNGTETIATVFGNSWAYIIPLTIVIVLTIVSALYFKKKSPSFAEEI